MEDIEIKYQLREQGIPYYHEEDLTKKSGLSLKEIEIFDGKDVKWGVREDYTSFTGKKTGRMTPLFENMVDENGEDKERFIYLNDGKILLHGKINDSEVLCRFTNNFNLDSQLVEVNDYGGKNVTITMFHGDALVKYYEENLPRCLFFNFEKFRNCSNIFDGVYDKGFFIKSFIVDGRLRMFLGKITYCPVEVKLPAYDINRQEFMTFPLTEDGLIDEEKMNEYFKKDKKYIGFDKDIYNRIDREDLSSILFDLKVYAFQVLTVLNKDVEYIERSKRKKL